MLCTVDFLEDETSGLLYCLSPGYGPVLCLTVVFACLSLYVAKKNKKKGKTLTLTDFLAEDSGSNNTSNYPPVKPTSWADETDDLEGDGECGAGRRLVGVG